MNNKILGVIALIALAFNSFNNTDDEKDNKVYKEFVNFRPEISTGLSYAIINNNDLDDLDDEDEEDTLCDGSGYIKHFDGHITECPGCPNCKGSNKEKEIVEKETPITKVDIKTEPPITKVEVNNYTPKWNVEGSWSRAESRQELITHLSQGIHNYTRSSLESFSTDDLQKLHDQDHERKRSGTVIKFSGGEYCPPEG